MQFSNTYATLATMTHRRLWLTVLNVVLLAMVLAVIYPARYRRPGLRRHDPAKEEEQRTAIIDNGEVERAVHDHRRA